MKAILVTDKAAGLGGMRLAQRPEPSAAINDVVVRISCVRIRADGDGVALDLDRSQRAISRRSRATSIGLETETDIR